MEPADHFFGTTNGRRRDPDRFRDRVLARSARLANERRAEQGWLFRDGRGGFRTCDLSRVKRALSH
jgi:hypothetical protein